mmetsp:Transcript_7962/g.14822  ORF Transcript_7962/g.14822 Transcript_7962/m.14822 type:complete len:214 (-) Transcript_7962:464-1105(-)
MVTSTENCGESESAVRPQIRNTQMRIAIGPSLSSKPSTAMQLPLTASEAAATRARPRRSPSLPPTQLPGAPIAITAKATKGAVAGDRSQLLSRKVATQAQTQKSSHMCPQYARIVSARCGFWNTAAHLANSRPPVDAGNGKGPGPTQAKTSKPLTAEAVEVMMTTGCQECDATMPRSRCGNAEPRQNAANITPIAEPRCCGENQVESSFTPGG